MPGNSMISLRNVGKVFPGQGEPAIRDLSFDVHEGQTVVLVGPSGCGKTTTLRMVNRLIDPSSGQILVDGTDAMKQDPVALRRRMGYVIQSIGLLPHRTVEQNIATVPKLVGWRDEQIGRRVRELAEILRLGEDLLRRYPNELSGGQRQRVGVARALAIDPPVMLMDEPFGAVDPIIRSRLQDQFLEIQQRLKKTILFVTHDIDEAIKMADRIAILNTGGVLEQFAPPEEILREPANDFVTEFVGPERGLKRLALIEVSVIEVEDGPVASPSDTIERALAAMDAFGLDWTAVVDDGRLLGWVDRRMLDGATMVGEAEPRPFSAAVSMQSSLREALDSIVTSRTNVAVVTGEDHSYLGILTVERISREIVA